MRKSYDLDVILIFSENEMSTWEDLVEKRKTKAANQPRRWVDLGQVELSLKGRIAWVCCTPSASELHAYCGHH